MRISRAFFLISFFLIARVAHVGDRVDEQPTRQMMEGFNKGDINLVKQAHIASPTIVDETHPFIWSGPKAFGAWLAQLTENEAEEGKTGGVV